MFLILIQSEVNAHTYSVFIFSNCNNGMSYVRERFDFLNAA